MTCWVPKDDEKRTKANAKTKEQMKYLSIIKLKSHWMPLIRGKKIKETYRISTGTESKMVEQLSTLACDKSSSSMTVLYIRSAWWRWHKIIGKIISQRPFVALNLILSYFLFRLALDCRPCDSTTTEHFSFLLPKQLLVFCSTH